jgi:branched-chain amino acid transport system substrate-binding protein
VKGTTLWKVAGLLCLALMIVALPVLTACNSGGGSSDATLKVGYSMPYTGVAAEKGRPMGNGQMDAIEYINSELGGVDGYQIEVIRMDNGYDTGQAISIINKFIDEDALLFTTASSKMMSVSMEMANEAGLAGFSVFSAPALTHPPQHIYAQMPDYGDDWAAFADYYMKNVWMGSEKPKMALHLLNNPTGFGARDAAKALAANMGIDIVAIEEHAADTGSEIESLTRIKDLDIDVLYISSTPAPTSMVIKGAVQLGLYPGVTIACGHAGMTSKLVELAGADVVEGVYGVFPTVSWGDDVPGMAKMTEYMLKNHPDDEGNGDYITAWAESLIVAEILRLALEEVDIEDLTPQAVEQYGFKRLNNYSPGGLHGPVTYTPGDNRLSKSVRVFQVQSGSIKPVSDWVEAQLIKYEDFDWFGQ